MALCSCKSDRHILIYSRSSSQHCSRNRLNAVVSWVEQWMSDERTLLWLQEKSGKASRFSCLPSLWRYFKISVGDFGGKNKYISTENLFKIIQRAGAGKICMADLLKIHPSVSRVVNALLCCDELYFPLDQSGVTIAAVTTAVNTTRSEAVSLPIFPLHPFAIKPTTPTHPRSPQVLSHQERWWPVKLNNRHLRSHWKKGLWTV